MNEKIEQLERILKTLEDTFERGQVSDIPIYQFRATLCIARGLQLIAESLDNAKLSWKDWKPKDTVDDPRPEILSKRVDDPEGTWQLEH